MFGANKPLNTFSNQPASSTFSSFNNPQQNTGFATAFSKPGGNFGAPTFGQQNTSVFGATQPATSLFGSTASTQQQGFGSKIKFFFVLIRKLHFVCIS